MAASVMETSGTDVTDIMSILIRQEFPHAFALPHGFPLIISQFQIIAGIGFDIQTIGVSGLNQGSIDKGSVFQKNIGQCSAIGIR
jgi:hypothetical protein